MFAICDTIGDMAGNVYQWGERQQHAYKWRMHTSRVVIVSLIAGVLTSIVGRIPIVGPKSSTLFWLSIGAFVINMVIQGYMRFKNGEWNSVVKIVTKEFNKAGNTMGSVWNSVFGKKKKQTPFEQIGDTVMIFVNKWAKVVDNCAYKGLKMIEGELRKRSR